MSRGRWLGGLVVAVATAGLGAAQDPKPLMDAKAFDKLVVDTLREVHDRGADLYNTRKDYAGAYRLYEGSLRTVRPMLAHRPDAQKIIDGGLAAAEKEPDPAGRAYLLHKAIEDVRANIRGLPAKAPEEKKPEEKKPETKPMESKKPEEKPAEKKPDPAVAPDPKAKAPAVTGTVTFEGKPVAAGVLTFVSLDQPKPKVTAAEVKDGKYSAELPPGKYAVAVSAPKDGKETLPAKFTTTDTSGLTVEVKAGANAHNFELKK
ncbi:MAG: carboxypeptidase-like regulatory domain-containing protein [Gemmataceae bacterium]|nr:carboxypeptidase-like regulatory domain-containing protein [Gemmataceae bacterium]